jgi:5-(carboxyamino)imidazole ribonucleotide synthase
MRVGVLGAGQLGRMLALAGIPLGMDFRFLDPAPGAPAARVGEQLVGAYDDSDSLNLLCGDADVVTYEFENVPTSAVDRLAARVPVYPPVEALRLSQDRLPEKQLFHRLGIPVYPYHQADTLARLERVLAAGSVPLPALLKTRRFGYDGKGQALLREESDMRRAWEAVGGKPSVLEKVVPFERELSIIGVRGRAGETVFYPLVENLHRDGILRRSLCPAPGVTPDLQAVAEGIAGRVLDALGYVGVLAVELFQVGSELYANEMAPRVHNSGHWTIDGAETSQFENHLRAITGLPLGSTRPRGYSAMLNLIGHVPDASPVLAITGAHLHLYGKEPRPGRKLGHITVCAGSPEGRDVAVAQVERRLGGGQ